MTTPDVPNRNDDRPHRLAPRSPSRTRVIRPDLFRDEITGRMTATEVVLYLGLTTCADDAGYVLWRPVQIAAAIWPYFEPPPGQTRESVLDAEARRLDPELLVIYQCGCAYLPRMVRDHGIKGGNLSYAVQEYHESHTQSVPGTDRVRTGSVTYTESSSETASASSSESVPGPESTPVSVSSDPLGRRAALARIAS